MTPGERELFAVCEDAATAAEEALIVAFHSGRKSRADASLYLLRAVFELGRAHGAATLTSGHGFAPAWLCGHVKGCTLRGLDAAMRCVQAPKAAGFRAEAVGSAQSVRTEARALSDLLAKVRGAG